MLYTCDYFNVAFNPKRMLFGYILCLLNAACVATAFNVYALCRGNMVCITWQFVIHVAVSFNNVLQSSLI